MNDQSLEELSFEAALTELEQVVSQLEAGDLPLNDALALYERGQALTARCHIVLDNADLRLESLDDMPSADGG